MNNKRQTIWLVSMLSLMVILSAYYLFTEDAPTNSASGPKTTHLLGDETKVSAGNPDGVSVTQVDNVTDELSEITPDGTVNEETSGKAEGTSAEPGEVTPQDEAVIKGLTNQKGSELLDQIAIDRQTKISQRAEELNNIISKTSKVTQEEAATAATELSKLEDTDLRIASLQEKLLQDFDNAVVSEVDTNFKVIVLSDKLEKKQAIGIIDLATKELDVTPDRVTVQYVQ